MIPQCPLITEKVEELTEAMKLFAYVPRIGFIEHRRDVLKLNLPGDFKLLAGKSYPPCPTSLVGPDLVDNIKTIKEVQVLSNKIKDNTKTTTFGPNRYEPYPRQRGQGFLRGSGRGRRRGRGRSDTLQPADSNPNHNNQGHGQGFRGRGATSK